jgi:hypothetical protein
MKDAEDEAFDELAKRQGDWGGGFQAKRQMAANKLQEPAQEPVAWISALTGDLTDQNMSHTVSWAPLYTTPPQPPQRTWVGLTDEERQDIALEDPMDAVFITEVKLKKRNHGT